MVDGRGLVGEAPRYAQRQTTPVFRNKYRTAKNARAMTLNKTVFDDANGDPCMAVWFPPMPDYSSFDCRTHILKWTMHQFHYETDRRREVHPSRQAQVQSRGTHIVD